MSNESLKISGLPPLSTVPESALLPTAVLQAENETYRVTLKDLRSALFFENAYGTLAEGIAGTVANNYFFLYTDSTENQVLAYQRTSDGAVAVLDDTGAQVVYGTGNLLRALSGTGAAGAVALANGGNVQQAIDYVFPEAFGTTNDEVRLQAAINYAVTSGKKLVCTGRSFTLNNTLTLLPGLNADFSGTTLLVGSTLTSGNAIVVDGSTSDAAGTYSGAIYGLRLIKTLVNGHADPNGTLDGISFGGTNGAHGLAFYNLTVLGFRDNVRFDGPNSYINHLYYPKIGMGWRRGIAVYATSNSNENYSIFGGMIYNINNTSFNGTGIYIDPVAGDTDIYLDGTSIDYCDYSGVIYQSSLSLLNCHLENNNNNPHILLSYTGAKAYPTLNMVGGSMTGGPGGTGVWTGIPVEQTGGRDALVYVTAAGSNNVSIVGTRCGIFSTANPRRTQLVKVQNNSAAVLGNMNLRPVLQAGNNDTSSRPLRICNALNGISTSQYSLTSWTQTTSRDDGTVTFSVDTTTYYDADSPHSRKYVGTAGFSTGLYQEVNCTGGQVLNINMFVNVTDLTAGYTALRVDFIDSKGNILDNGSSIKTITAVTSGWQQVWVYMKATNGAVKVRIQEYYNSFTGTAYYSNENVWVH